MIWGRPGIARGWHGGAASPILGCNETWGGLCKNHTYVDYINDPTFFGCPATSCNPNPVNGTRELCPGKVSIPCPKSGKCPGDSSPGSACHAWKNCQPGGSCLSATSSCRCPRSCPSHKPNEWCVKSGFGKWVSTTENCTEPSLTVCAGDAGALGCAICCVFLFENAERIMLTFVRRGFAGGGAEHSAAPGRSDSAGLMMWGCRWLREGSAIAVGGACARHRSCQAPAG